MNPIKSCTQVNQVNLTIGVYEGGEKKGEREVLLGSWGVLELISLLSVLSFQGVLSQGSKVFYQF